MENRKQITDFYDQLWQEQIPDEENQRRRRFHHTCRDWAFSHFNTLEGARLLEIGPGRGQETLNFADRGATVYAVDISHVALVTLATKATHRDQTASIHPLEMVGEQLGLASESVDYVFSETTLMHTDPLAIARECARVLKPGGKAIFVEPLKNNPLVALYRRFSHYRATRPTYLTLSTFKEMGAYFQSYHHREFYLLSVVVSWADPGRPVGNALVTGVQQLDTWICDVLPASRQWCWMTAAIYTK